MTQKLHFTKMHAAGNDYIYVDTLLYNIARAKELAVRLSKPHFGIGADGLVLIGQPEKASDADFSMRIFNADGSEAQMCGNASRCIAKYVYEKGLTRKTDIRLQTASGVKTLRLSLDSKGRVERVTVDMLEPAFSVPSQYDEQCNGRITVDGRTFNGVFVSMGNPHFVCFADDADNIDVAHYGALLEDNAAFPEGCNIEFAQLTGTNRIRMRVWERGSGITMACGTGACAAAVASKKLSLTDGNVQIDMDGGALDIEWKADDNHVYMTGDAHFVYEGDIDLNEDF